MPINESEWAEESITTEDDYDETNPVGEYDTEKDLVLAFLSENHDSAFTRAEIVKGVDFGESEPPETVAERLLNLPNQLVDIAGDITATGFVVDDVSEALDALVEEGTVEKRKVKRPDGEPEIYYRLAD